MVSRGGKMNDDIKTQVPSHGSVRKGHNPIPLSTMG